MKNNQTILFIKNSAFHVI
ncbi:MULTISPECIES: hypothetical protein [Eubacterium]|nr:hypothetical protein [Eubacterium sp.]